MPRMSKPSNLLNVNNRNVSKQERENRFEKEKELAGLDDELFNVPEFLDDLAKLYYMEIVLNLKESSLPVCNLDIQMIAQCANCLSKIEQSEEFIQNLGLIVEELDRYGKPCYKPNPAIKIQNDAITLYQRTANKIGLDPSSRAAMAANVQSQQDEDPLLSILGKS